MALSIFRFFRFLRSICAPMASVICFSFLLTWIFILYQPTPGPGALQRMGWQAWDVVSMSTTDRIPVDDNAKPGKTEPQDGVDWWNVTTEKAQTDTASLPLDVWSPILPHDTGLTEIEVVKCLFPSSMTYLCGPKSSPQEDSHKGKWVRVGPNLNRGIGLWSLHLYYRRSRRLDVPLITDITLLPEAEEPATRDGWHKAGTSIRDGVPRIPKLFLWYRLGKPVNELSPKEKDNLVTEVDILYGEDRAWYGFEKVDPPTFVGKGKYVSVWVTYRRGVKPIPPAPPLHFSHNGTFKILQIADLHFSVAEGFCRDVSFTPCTGSDNLTNSLLMRVIDKEQPSMVVFSGDQLNGQGSSWDSKSVLAKFAAAVTDKGIPWAAVFGNHDDENSESREVQAKLLQALPYSLMESGPSDIHGVGNYFLQVKSADPSKTNLLTLYFMDSGAYSKGFMDWFGFFHPTEYDWIHQDQIDWFLEESARIGAIERPFTPDGARDFGNSWKRQSAGQVAPGLRKLAKPNAMMFFHIPLQESYAAADVNSKTNIALDVGEHTLEKSGAAKGNDGFFHKGILEAMESDHTASSNLREVKVVANGHCHLTENCRRVKGVWLCFGGGGSFSGYGKVGFDRRFRIYEISDFGETIRTYKRTEKGDIVDDMILVGKGAPPPYDGSR